MGASESKTIAPPMPVKNFTAGTIRFKNGFVGRLSRKDGAYFCEIEVPELEFIDPKIPEFAKETPPSYEFVEKMALPDNPPGLSPEDMFPNLAKIGVASAGSMTFNEWCRLRAALDSHKFLYEIGDFALTASKLVQPRFYFRDSSWYLMIDSSTCAKLETFRDIAHASAYISACARLRRAPCFQANHPRAVCYACKPDEYDPVKIERTPEGLAYTYGREVFLWKMSPEKVDDVLAGYQKNLLAV